MCLKNNFNPTFFKLILILIPLVIKESQEKTPNPTVLTSIDQQKAREWITAFLADLEFADFPAIDPDHESNKQSLIDSLLHHSTIKGFPYVKFFENNIKIFSEIAPNTSKAFPHLSTSSQPLTYNDSCDPLHHSNINPKDVTKESIPESDLYEDLHQWQNLVLNNTNNTVRLCNAHLGLVCPRRIKKCTCMQDTEWITPPGKCYLHPQSNCTFRDLNIQGYFHDIIDPDYIIWFTRMLIHPMTYPVCGIGLYCDTFGLSPPICYCLDKKARDGCQNHSTYDEVEPVEKKLRRLFIPLNNPCAIPITDILNAIRDLDDPEIDEFDKGRLKHFLVDRKVKICNFEVGEFCNPSFLMCRKRCPKAGEILDDVNMCKFNNAEQCEHLDSDKLSEETQCVKNARCEIVEDVKVNDTTTGKHRNVLACICQPMQDPILKIESYWFGHACTKRLKNFWLKLLKPFESGEHGSRFLALEQHFQNSLDTWDNLTSLGLSQTCDPSLDLEALKVVKYFGNLKEAKKDEYEIVLQIIENFNESMCDYKNFLRCDQITSTCVPMDNGVLFNETTREPQYKSGKVCNEPISDNIFKIFYHNDEKKDSEGFPNHSGIQCVENSFCVVDYKFPIEETTDFRGKNAHKKRCRCHRGYSGPDCKVKGPLEDYDSKEKEKLLEVLEFRKNNSVRQHKDLCFIDIEKKLPKKPEEAVDTVDLYELISIFEPTLKSVDPLEAEVGLHLCNVSAYLRCVETKLHPVKRSSQTVAICDCMHGFERVMREHQEGCFVSDGEICGESWSPTLSTTPVFSSIGPGCASERCLNSSDGVFRCDEDLSFLYFVPFHENQASLIMANHYKIVFLIMSFSILNVF